MKRQRLLLYALSSFLFFMVACSNRAVPRSTPATRFPIYREQQTSQAEENVLSLTVDQSGLENGQLIATIANSSSEMIELVRHQNDSCFAKTIWFYAKSVFGWKPLAPGLSTVCDLFSRDELRMPIPAGEEVIFDLTSILYSRYGLEFDEPDTRPLLSRMVYMALDDNEAFLYSDEFVMPDVETVEDIKISVSPVEGGLLNFEISNDSGKPIWLVSPCSKVNLQSVMDQAVSTLQQLTDADTWRNIPIDDASCLQQYPLLPVQTDGTIFTSSQNWISTENLLLTQGTYRWDIVLYLDATDHDVSHGFHVFSSEFEVTVEGSIN